MIVHGVCRFHEGLARHRLFSELVSGMDAHVVAIGQGHVPSGLMSFSTYDPQTLADAVSAFCGSGPIPFRCAALVFPLKIMQYRAQGVLIVAPDIGDCSLLMEGCGQLVSADNRSQWLGAIHEEWEKIPNNSAHLAGVGQSLCALVGHQP